MQDALSPSRAAARYQAVLGFLGVDDIDVIDAVRPTLEGEDKIRAAETAADAQAEALPLAA